MVKLTTGNLLDADVEALVNTVNTVGVMGKGIALQFRQAFPKNYEAYKAACNRGKVKIGKMFVFDLARLSNPRFIINFPTKRHWKQRAKIEDIDAGLQDLRKVVQELSIGSIAVPPLGCGNGGLAWGVVRKRIEKCLSDLPDVNIHLFEPTGAPPAEEMPVATKRPRMTIGRAVLVRLMQDYALPGYRLTLLEVQKLAYFLQVARQPLNLDFVKGKYGPYADTLEHVLQRIEGHFIRGYGDRSRDASIRLLPGTEDEAVDTLNKFPESFPRLKRVSSLIEGFETPYGMELLATVHWSAQEAPKAKDEVTCAINAVQTWSKHKRQTFVPNHIAVAWERLHEQDWL